MLAYRPLLSLAVFPLLVACAHQGAHTLTLTQDQQSRCPVALNVGQQLILNLPSNPSTGYRWQLHEAANPVLRSLGPEVYNASDSGEVVGSGGIATWRFRIEQPGSATLSLLYQQPWALDEAPAERFDCVINAK